MNCYQRNTLMLVKQCTWIIKREQIDGNLEILDTTNDGSYSVRVATIMDIDIIQEAILKRKENDHV